MHEFYQELTTRGLTNCLINFKCDTSTSLYILSSFVVIIIYFLPDSEAGNESEIPSRHEVGAMDMPFVLYLGQKPWWACLREETEEKIYRLRGFPSNTFTSCIAGCLLLWPVFVAVITGEVYWRSKICWKSNFNFLKYFIFPLMYCSYNSRILFKTLITGLPSFIAWKWFNN